MPYIPSLDRMTFESTIDTLAKKLTPERPGDMNYVISSIVTRVLKRDLTYSNANAIIGVLECVKQELYRKVISDYENLKEKENGSI